MVPTFKVIGNGGCTSIDGDPMKKVGCKTNEIDAPVLELSGATIVPAPEKLNDGSEKMRENVRFVVFVRAGNVNVNVGNVAYVALADAVKPT